MFKGNKRSKALISLALTLSLLNFTMESTVQAVNLNSGAANSSGKISYSNTINYEGTLPKYLASETFTVSTLLDFESKIKDAVSKRADGVIIKYTGNELVGSYSDYILDAMKRATRTAGNDYEKLLVSKYEFNAQIGSNRSFTANCQFTYLETALQVQQVKDKVKTVLLEIIKPNMTDSDKIRAINQYICKTLAYDTTLTNYSAYAGLLGNNKTVCQGYSLLAYRMLTEAGIETRIITGEAGGNAHAWNMVKVAGEWYHLDTTWNDPVPDKVGRYLETYLLLSSKQISTDHTWDVAVYPVAPKSYVESTTLPVVVPPVVKGVVDKLTDLNTIDNGTVMIGNRVFSLMYANDTSNIAEITAEIIKGGKIYVKDFTGNWIDNLTGINVMASSIVISTVK